MEEQLAPLYRKLGQQIVDMIPDEWDEIYYLGEVGLGRTSCSSVFYYVDPSCKKWIRSHKIPDIYGVSRKIYEQLLTKLNRVLLEIYDCFREHDHPEWEQLTFHIDKQGEFSAQFKYDLIDNRDVGPFMSEVAWAYQTFGYQPDENSYLREVLDRWLSQEKN